MDEPRPDPLLRALDAEIEDLRLRLLELRRRRKNRADQLRQRANRLKMNQRAGGPGVWAP